MYICRFELAASAAARCSLKVCVNSNCDESEDDYCNEEITDIGKSLFPNLVAETEALECAPETMAKVKAESYEPYDIDGCHPPSLECCVKKLVRIMLYMSGRKELLKLHLCPEMVEVECYEAENDNSEKKHVLSCPRLCLTLASASITLNTTASAKVTCCEDECIDDVYKETSCKNWNHDSHDWKCHKIAASLEKSFCKIAIYSVACVNHRKEVDCHVKEKEKNKEKAAYAHDKLLGNR